MTHTPSPSADAGGDVAGRQPSRRDLQHRVERLRASCSRHELETDRLKRLAMQSASADESPAARNAVDAERAIELKVIRAFLHQAEAELARWKQHLKAAPDTRGFGAMVAQSVRKHNRLKPAHLLSQTTQEEEDRG